MTNWHAANSAVAGTHTQLTHCIITQQLQLLQPNSKAMLQHTTPNLQILKMLLCYVTVVLLHHAAHLLIFQPGIIIILAIIILVSTALHA